MPPYVLLFVYLGVQAVGYFCFRMLLYSVKICSVMPVGFSSSHSTTVHVVIVKLPIIGFLTSSFGGHSTAGRYKPTSALAFSFGVRSQVLGIVPRLWAFSPKTQADSSLKRHQYVFYKRSAHLTQVLSLAFNS